MVFNQRVDHVCEPCHARCMTPAAHHRLCAAVFSERVDGTRDWDVPTPVDGWTARDVVGHLTSWFPSFLAGSSDLRLPEAPDEPVAAWRAQTAAVQALLDDPATAATLIANPHIGEMTLGAAADMIYTPDVFMHTWDLSRATGQDDRLDPGYCEALLTESSPMEEAMRGSGQYGPRVDVPDDADVQTRLLGFIGRDPEWRAR